MEKKQESIEKLLTGNLNLNDRSESNLLYIELSEKLASKDVNENAKAVAALLKVEEKTGKEPEFEAPAGTGIKRCLGQDIRDGLVTPSEESENLYLSNKKEPLPGKKDLSDQEISLRDLEIGIKAAGYESGVKPSSKDQMALEMLNGKSQEDKLTPAPFGEQENDMTFGPSKVIKGLLTQDPKEVAKGLEETIKVGEAESLKELLTLSPVFKPMQKLSEIVGNSITGQNKDKERTSNPLFEDTLLVTEQQAKVEKDGFKLEDLFDSKKDPLHPDQIGLDLNGLRDSLVNLNEKGTALVGEISDAFKTGKVGKEINSLIDVSKNGSLEDVENHVENMFGRLNKKIDQKTEEPEKKGEKKQEDAPDWSAQLAGSIAGAATYKAGRAKGINPKKSGEMSDIARDEATDIAKSTKSNEESKDKSVELLKNTKNMMAKTAANVVDKIPTPPGLGKAIAVGIIVADKATDFMIDLINNKGGADALSKASGDIEQADKEKGKDTPAAAQQSMVGDGNVEVFKEEMKKTKGGLVKRLIPTKDDVITSAMKGAVDGIGSWGKEQVSGRKGSAEDIHRQLDQPS